jgi:nitrate/TMAO reductase-like tetraheme cytochrome c subunit
VPQPAHAVEVAVQSEPLRWGGVLDWSIGLSIILAALILVCIAVSLVLYRGRQTEGSALWLHLLALGVLPLFLLATGNFAVMEYATEERFCATCHLTMKPYVDDLQNPKSPSLAAAHFQNRFAPGTECYSCHADYGLHGTFSAKLTGLRHVYKYATGTYHLPIKLPAPFENTLCLKCHNGAKRFMAQDVHLEGGKVSEELTTGKTECVQCHSPAHEIPKAKTAAAGGGGGS